MCNARVGQRAVFSKTITVADIEAFAMATGDENPVHLDDCYAATTRFGGRIAHGILTVGLISACIAQNWPGSIYLSQQARFVKPVRPNDRITADVEVTALDVQRSRITLRTVCINQNGEQVVDGSAEVWLPREVGGGL
ncbi:MAG: MaoC family dehydratase [Chloroflexota bacterium]|nr:MaoC family dehydratase [Chloroflexota bacterium]